MATSSSFVEAAINANRQNFLKKASSWAEADPLFTVKELEGATAVFSGSSTDTFNVLVLERDAKRTAFQIIDEARSNIFGENRFAVWSWQDGQLQDLPVDSAAIEENLIMACDVSELEDIPAVRKPLAATEAKEPQHLMDVASVLGAVFGESEEGFMVQSVLAGVDDAGLARLPVKYLVAYEDGGAVASASYILDGTTAGIYDVAVPPALQKKGTGSRMFDTVIKAAREAGATSFTLQASADGTKIYERAGFDVLGACWCLDIA